MAIIQEKGQWTGPIILDKTSLTARVAPQHCSILLVRKS